MNLVGNEHFIFTLCDSHLIGYSLETLTTELVGRRKTPMIELFGIPVLKQVCLPSRSNHFAIHTCQADQLTFGYIAGRLAGQADGASIGG